ncbi:MAG: hypothetical protein HGB26_03020 [Desulfobulbaceae bacterium]|nr:hypothetical protein [Desulfobulbaceae bacterium]
MDLADKICTVLFVVLAAGAMIFSHVNQGLRNEIAALESLQNELARASVVGWWSIDPVTSQLVFISR